MLGKKPPYKIGQQVVILWGPFKGSMATIVEFVSGHPRQWVSVRATDGDTLLYDWNEISSSIT